MAALLSLGIVFYGASWLTISTRVGMVMARWAAM